MKPSLEDMQVFLTVVEARTFTLAAERLARTKSAVSQTITRLENDLGARLLHRSTRSLSLTETGAQFYSHCREIKDIYHTALSDIKAKPSGVLSITAPHALCKSLVDPAIKAFIETNPDMSIRLIADDSAVDLVESQVDLAIRVGELDLQAAKAAKIGTLYESLYATPEYIAQQGGMPDNLMDIATWTHIASDWQGTPVKYNIGSKEVLRVNPKIRCNSLNSIIDLVEMGIGVARLPDITVARNVTQRTLVKIKAISKAPVHYMHLFSKNPPAKVQSFIQLLKARL